MQEGLHFSVVEMPMQVWQGPRVILLHEVSNLLLLLGRGLLHEASLVASMGTAA